MAVSPCGLLVLDLAWIPWFHIFPNGQCAFVITLECKPLLCNRGLTRLFSAIQFLLYIGLEMLEEKDNDNARVSE